MCALPPACLSTRTASPRRRLCNSKRSARCPSPAHRALVSVASRAAELVQPDRPGERRRRKPGSMVRSDRAYRRNASSMANPRARDRRSGIPALAGMDRRFVLRESGAPLKPRLRCRSAVRGVLVAQLRSHRFRTRRSGPDTPSLSCAPQHRRNAALRSCGLIGSSRSQRRTAVGGRLRSRGRTEGAS